MNDDRTGNLAGLYAIKDTDLTLKLYKYAILHLNKPQLKVIKDLIFNVEIPFMHITAKAEQRGIHLNRDYLIDEVAPKLLEDLEVLQKQIYEFTGPVNLSSPVQVAEALYDRMCLPQVNRDTPRSTDKKTLNKLKSHHEVAGLILKYRGSKKLYDSFAVTLPDKALTGIVHCNFNTTGTSTGRLSCSNPNL